MSPLRRALVHLFLHRACSYLCSCPECTPNQLDDLVPPCCLPTPLSLYPLLAPSSPLDSHASLVPHSTSAPHWATSPPRASRTIAPLRPVSALAMRSLSSPVVRHHSGSTGLPLPSGYTLVSHHYGFAAYFRGYGCASSLHPFGSSFTPARPWTLGHSVRPPSLPQSLKPATLPWTSGSKMSHWAVILKASLGSPVLPPAVNPQETYKGSTLAPPSFIFAMRQTTHLFLNIDNIN